MNAAVNTVPVNRNDEYPYLVDQNGDYYYLCSDDSGWTWGDGENTQSFTIKDRRVIHWGRPQSRKHYGPTPTHTPTHVLRVRTKGRGYSGGHNTAARLGWTTRDALPEKNAILWWDDTDQGRHTGYYPATVSLIPVPDPTLEQAARDVFEHKPGAFRRLKEACRK